MVEVKLNPFKSVIITDTDGSDLRIDEGMIIRFATEDGEIVEGELDSITGKGTKVKFLINPPSSSRQELWMLSDIESGSVEIARH